MLKLKMMLCVMMLPLVFVVGCTSKQSVSQCVKPPPSGVDNAASRLADTAERDYFTLRERLIAAKTTGRNPKYINEQCNRVAHIDGQLMQFVSNTHALPAEYKCLK